MPNIRRLPDPASARGRTCRRLAAAGLWLAATLTAQPAAAQITFTRHAACPAVTDAPDIEAVDFNGDGRADLLVGGLDHVVLCTNDGQGTFAGGTLVAAPGGRNTKVAAGDLDGDGHMDVVGIDRTGDALIWWQSDGAGGFTRHVIAAGIGGPRDLYVTDVNADGRPDILVATDAGDQVLWWRNDGVLPAVPEQLYIADRNSSHYRLAVMDMTAGSQAATIAMLSGAPGELAASPDGTVLYAVDGTDVEQIDAATNTVTATVAGVGGNGTSTHLSLSPDGAVLYVAADSNSGPRVSLVAAGAGTVSSTITSAAFNPCSKVAGFGVAPDGARLYLACTASSGSGRFFVINPAAGTVTQTATFTNPVFNAAYVNAMAVNPAGNEVYLAEGGLSLFTPPGHVEIFDAATGAFKQEVGLPGFLLSLAQAATVSADGKTMYVADALNGLHVVDTATATVTANLAGGTSRGYDAALSADGGAVYTATGNTVHITRTSDNSYQSAVTGGFSSPYSLAVTPGTAPRLAFTRVVIADGFGGAVSVRSGDIDRDGRPDVAAAAHAGGRIAWWRQNADGSFTEHTVDNGFDTAAAVRSADIDGDGWPDLAAISDGVGGAAQGIAWWRNNHDGSFSRANVAALSGPELELADLDNDGRADLGATLYGTAQVPWWRYGASGFTAGTVDTANGAQALELTDVNGDGYTDVIESGPGEGIYWWGNDGGSGGVTGGPAFGFNAVETQSGPAPAADKDAVAGKIHTKVVGQDFVLDVVALRDGNGDGAADGVKADYAADTDRTVQIQAGTGSCNSFAAVETLTSAVFSKADAAKDQGRVQVKLKVNEAGQNLRLRMVDDNGTPDPADDVTGCSTDVFTVRPYRYSLDVRQQDWETAGGAVDLNGHDADTPVIHKAGRPVRVVVQALDTNSRPAAGFSGHTVTLKETKGDAGMRDGNYFYVGGATPAQLTFGGSGGGTVTDDTATYNEVGWLYLRIDDDGAYAAAGGDGPPNDNSTPAEMDILGSGQTQVGRFVPDHFTVTVDDAGAFRAACGGTYTYLAQPFGTFLAQPRLTITAKNAMEQTTLNYQGAYWKLADIAEVYSHYSPALPAGVSFSGGVSGNVHAPSAAAGSAGTVSLTFTQTAVSYTRGLTAVAPFSSQVDLQFPLQDRDGVTCTACGGAHRYSLASGSGAGIAGPGELRYGRLAFTPSPTDNFGEGPETSPIDLRLRAEYFDGGQWQLNSEDACTALGAANYDLASSVQDPPLGAATVKVGGGASTVTISGSPLAGVPATLSFSAPGSLNYGTVQFTVDLANGAAGSRYPWLMYDWNGDGTADSLEGSVRFGPFENNRWMYMRESW